MEVCKAAVWRGTGSRAGTTLLRQGLIDDHPAPELRIGHRSGSESRRLRIASFNRLRSLNNSSRASD